MSNYSDDSDFKEESFNIEKGEMKTIVIREDHEQSIRAALIFLAFFFALAAFIFIICGIISINTNGSNSIVPSIALIIFGIILGLVSIALCIYVNKC